jgi:hypothetical protein
MSVLACDRRGCDNVMCDRYSHTYGYICNECFEELVALGANVDIEVFMKTPPIRNFHEYTRKKYEGEFPLR